MSPESAATKEPGLTLGCFEVGSHTFGMDVASIREIVRWRTVKPLSGSPPLIEGVIELRGTLIPVVDLGRALGEGPIGETARARIVISQTGGLVLGLVVQRATDVLTVEASDLSGPAATVSPNSAAVIQAIARRPGADPIVVLSLEPLLRLVRDSASSTREVSA